MKIIVPGLNPEDKKFECPNCGCGFIANKDEYRIVTIGVMLGTGKTVYRQLECECPTCGWNCTMDDEGEMK